MTHCTFAPTSSPAPHLGHRRVLRLLRATAASLAVLSLLACVGPDPAETPDLGADLAPPQLDLAGGSPFLMPSLYVGELAIDPTFPFGVTRRYVTSRKLLGAGWGRHNGPMTTGMMMLSGMDRLAVTRFRLPAQSTGTLVIEDVAVATAPGLPAMLFYNAMIDLPFDNAALLTYTGSGAHYPGEAILYDANYTAVQSRAFTNGFYDATSPGAGLIFSTGLSGLAAAALPTGENGLWRSTLCHGAVAPSGTCAPSHKLFGWDGYSGPVTRDIQGNVFAAASLSAGAATDEVYALTAAESLSEVAIVPATLLSLSTSGTSSIAAVAPTADKPGWLLQKGYDGPMVPVSAIAQPYKESTGHLRLDGTAVARALLPGPAATGFTLLIDPRGVLWVAVSEKAQSVLIELQRLP